MIKLIASIYIKLVSICFGVNLISTSIFLQVIPPSVKKGPLISEAVQLALIQMLGLVGVAFFTNWKANKIKSEVVTVKEKMVGIETEVGTVKTSVAGIETEVTEVKTSVGGVHKEVETLKINNDGKLSELMQAQKELSEKIGIEKGIEISKVKHDAQSEKDKESNIAIGVLKGKEEAETKLATTPDLPIEVEIVQPEGKPAPVVIKEKKEDEKK